VIPESRDDAINLDCDPPFVIDEEDGAVPAARRRSLSGQPSLDPVDLMSRLVETTSGGINDGKVTLCWAVCHEPFSSSILAL
jgi:hypothetical protein